jgi:hypothetical protein
LIIIFSLEEKNFGVMEVCGMTGERWKMGALHCKAASLAVHLPFCFLGPPYYSLFDVPVCELLLFLQVLLSFLALE